MNLRNLHLEKVKIPKNILKTQGADSWECFDYEPFIVNVAAILHNEKDAISYSLEFSPADDDFSALNRKLEEQKYISDGYGWTDFILDKLKNEQVVFTGVVEDDSESETCVLVTFSEGDFLVLLQKTSEYIRGLFKAKSDVTEDDIRTITINRFWSHEDKDDEIDKPEIMFNRPRVDGRISEYVWGFLEENVLEQKKILQTSSLNITLFMGPVGTEDYHLCKSIYNDGSKNFFSLLRGNKLKEITVFCYYDGFSRNMTPLEYASVIYDMYCSVLVDYFKKITKEECDKLKIKMSSDVINSYQFPSPFENQCYSGDEGGYGGKTINGKAVEKSLPYNYREVYIREFGV